MDILIQALQAGELRPIGSLQRGPFLGTLSLAFVHRLSTRDLGSLPSSKAGSGRCWLAWKSSRLNIAVELPGTHYSERLIINVEQ